MDLGQEWYCEFLHKSMVVNPPGVVNFLWQVGRACLSENTLSKIHVVSKLDDLRHFNLTPQSQPEGARGKAGGRQHMDPAAIPEAYGGTYRDESGFGLPAFATPDPQPITPADYFPVGQLWDHLGSPLLSSGLSSWE